MKNKNDISISENLWIDWIEFDYSASKPKDIDNFTKWHIYRYYLPL